MTERPNVENAPGLTWRLRKGGWQARWQARRDLIARGYTPRAVNLWVGQALTDTDRAFISSQCNTLQTEMLIWGRGGIPELAEFDGTLGGLIRCYRLDADSSYRKLRYHVRRSYDWRLNRLDAKLGATQISEFRARMFNRWYEEWATPAKPEDGPKTAGAHAMITMVRTLFKFGAAILEDPECMRLSMALRSMRFEKEKPREEALTTEQADAIRAKAHEMGYGPVALAQSLQYDGILRQKDVIGEWVPLIEPGTSDVHSGNDKWLRGLRWSEIDENLILRHVTSKRQKPIEIDLKLAPMVLEELSAAFPGCVAKRVDPISGETTVTVRRDLLAASGPVIVCPSTGLPYRAETYRSQWRKVARAAGVPDHVFNMDSRAGGITEATASGALLEDVRHAATHSDVKMTARYSRASEKKTRNVQIMRAAHRNKGGTK